MPKPEIIEGLGQFRAGHGAIVTNWCATREEALAEFDRLVGEQIAEAIIKITRGETVPYLFARTNDAGDSPRYRADMIDAGRGRLLK